MHATANPSTLGPEKLAARLCELAGAERHAQVEFLLHLDEFDRRRAYLDAGYASLWDFCLRELHLREGAAGRRIGAMRVLRRFPALQSALRDGRLCLSTVALLGQVLTDANVDELVAKAAYRTKAEVDHLVASLQPRAAPKEGIRKVPEPRDTGTDAVPQSPPGADSEEPPTHALADGAIVLVAPRAETFSSSAAAPPAPSHTAPAPFALEEPRARAEMRGVSKDQWSLRVTIDGACKADLESLTALLSHKTGGDLAAVLHEAIRCGLEKHGKRRGAVKPARERNSARPREPKTVDAREIPMAVRRDVWKRDGGCCAWKGKDGRRCGSRWKLELDHIRPVALGGPSTVENLRLLCRTHNLLHAEQVFGREHMARFRRGASTIAGAAGDSAAAGTSGGDDIPPLFAKESGFPWGTLLDEAVQVRDLAVRLHLA